jgi:hypothetical protein
VLRRFTRTADGNRLGRRFPHRRQPASADRHRDCDRHQHTHTDCNGYIDPNAFADRHVYGDSNGHRKSLAYSDGRTISNVHFNLISYRFGIADGQRIADGHLHRHRHINIHGARKRAWYIDGYCYRECQCLRVPNFERHSDGGRDANRLADRRGYQYAVLRDGRHRDA